VRIDVLNGVNLDMLSRRDPELYGGLSLSELESRIYKWASELGVSVRCRQTNQEGLFVAWCHDAADVTDGIVVNPGAWTHYSWAIRDAVELTGKPVVEVHFANVMAPPTAPRGLPGGPWESRFTKTATGLCMGLRQYSYIGALTALVLSLDDEEFLGA
jgi:3-dehydroquinate dehydratase-2